VEGPRRLPTRMINFYVDRFQAAAEQDIVLTERFFRVAGLLEPPTRLLRPSTVVRVAAGNLRWRGMPKTGPTAPATRVSVGVARAAAEGPGSDQPGPGNSWSRPST
jgi:hypothetical protein